MKKTIILIISFGLLLIAIPATALALTNGKGLFYKDYSFGKKVRLLCTADNSIETLTDIEYLTGCLLAQISDDINPEVLKAQAVATHTLTLYYMEQKPYSETADITDNVFEYQQYFSPAEAEKYYGDRYEKALSAAKSAAEFGVQYAITYNNQLIYAAYHAISTGKTVCAKDLGFDCPYLQEVESTWDTSCTTYSGSREVDVLTAGSLINSYVEDAKLPTDYSQWFHDIKTTANGVVISAGVGSKTLSGLEIWRLFDIRSPAFTVSYSESKRFVFKTRGYGSGLGMSQYGADFLAKQGDTWDEILHYYYSNVTIIQV